MVQVLLKMVELKKVPVLVEKDLVKMESKEKPQKPKFLIM